MKLRNKKTGEIGELAGVMRLTIYEPNMPLCGNSILGQYDSLAELCDDWGDYAPAEPLIKDEKIRKAVRAWAEANDYGDDEEYQFEDFSTGWKSWSLEHKRNGDDNEIHFNGGVDFEKMNHQGYYTIAELCGEEKE